MPDKKDLVEAYAFSRRRLVAAFVSGAPGGREVEPVRTGRTVLGGVALAVLLLAGAAVAGTLHDQSDVDWDEPALITDSGTGALYVNLGDLGDQPGLRPVANVTSARLILGDDAKPVEVPTEEIAGRDKGPAIGIIDAPAVVPPRRELINSGWTACTAAGLDTRLAVFGSSGVEEVPEAGLVVTDGEDEWLIASAPAAEGLPSSAHRYRFPPRGDDLHATLEQVIPDDAITVDDAWLSLFPEGGSLDASGLAIPDAGEPAPAGVGYPPGAEVGDYFDRGKNTYIILRSGQVEATDFALAVLDNASFDGWESSKVSVSDQVELDSEKEPYVDARWPTTLPQRHQQLTSTQVCAVLHTEPGEPPSVGIGLDPDDEARAEPGAEPVHVDPGHGAVVRSGSWADATGGPVFLVDDRGMSYRLADQEAVDNLGYHGIEWRVIPDVWLKMFAPGVGLSRGAALCPPESGDKPPQCA